MRNNRRVKNPGKGRIERSFFGTAPLNYYTFYYTPLTWLRNRDVNGINRIVLTSLRINKLAERGDSSTATKEILSSDGKTQVVWNQWAIS